MKYSTKAITRVIFACLIIGIFISVAIGASEYQGLSGKSDLIKISESTSPFLSYLQVKLLLIS